jgi:hypothetical protein
MIFYNPLVKLTIFATITQQLLANAAEYADKRKLKILVNANTLGWSHVQLQSRLADILVEAGHEVHVLVFHTNPFVEWNNDILHSKAHRVFHARRSEEARREVAELDIVKAPFSGIKNQMDLATTDIYPILANSCRGGSILLQTSRN